MGRKGTGWELVKWLRGASMGSVERFSTLPPPPTPPSSLFSPLSSSVFQTVLYTRACWQAKRSFAFTQALLALSLIVCGLEFLAQSVFKCVTHNGTKCRGIVKDEVQNLMFERVVVGKANESCLLLLLSCCVAQSRFHSYFTLYTYVCVCIRNWPLPIGAFQDQCKQTIIN